MPVRTSPTLAQAQSMVTDCRPKARRYRDDQRWGRTSRSAWPAPAALSSQAGAFSNDYCLTACARRGLARQMAKQFRKGSNNAKLQQNSIWLDDLVRSLVSKPRCKMNRPWRCRRRRDSRFGIQESGRKAAGSNATWANYAGRIQYSYCQKGVSA